MQCDDFVLVLDEAKCQQDGHCSGNCCKECCVTDCCSVMQQLLLLPGNNLDEVER
jgi:hypothetical protein